MNVGDILWNKIVVAISIYCFISSCENFCVYNSEIAIISVFEGFDFILVGIILGVVIIITLFMYFIKRGKYSEKTSLHGSILSINETNGEVHHTSYNRIIDERISSKDQINNVKNFN